MHVQLQNSSLKPFLNIVYGIEISVDTCLHLSIFLILFDQQFTDNLQKKYRVK